MTSTMSYTLPETAERIRVSVKFVELEEPADLQQFIDLHGRLGDLLTTLALIRSYEDYEALRHVPRFSASIFSAVHVETTSLRSPYELLLSVPGMVAGGSITAFSLVRGVFWIAERWQDLRLKVAATDLKVEAMRLLFDEVRRQSKEDMFESEMRSHDLERAAQTLTMIMDIDVEEGATPPPSASQLSAE